jgi:hypothetical protein
MVTISQFRDRFLYRSSSLKILSKTYEFRCHRFGWSLWLWRLEIFAQLQSDDLSTHAADEDRAGFVMAGLLCG